MRRLRGSEAKAADNEGRFAQRVRYRQERRGIIREVIVGQLAGIVVQEHINDRAMQCVAENDLELFIEDINEDLGAISPHTIAGMGITVEQLQNWLQLKQ